MDGQVGVSNLVNQECNGANFTATTGEGGTSSDLGLYVDDLAYDECGVCGGDNSTCLDCAGIPNGGLERR